jgi:hypothetical protein
MSLALVSTAVAQTPSVAGTWKLSLVADHVVPTALVLELHGADVSGTFSVMNKPVDVKGTFASNLLELKGTGLRAAGPGDHGTMPTTGMDFVIKGTFDAEENTIAGTLAIDGGPTFKFTAERLRERPRGAPAPPAVAVNVSGSWAMGLEEGGGQIAEAALTLTQTGERVTGRFENDHLGAVPLEGTVVDGRLTLKGTAVVNGTEYPLTFTAVVQPDGSLKGDAASVMGTMPWTARRVK